MPERPVSAALVLSQIGVEYVISETENNKAQICPRIAKSNASKRRETKRKWKPLMKSLVKLLMISLGLLTIAACQTSTSEPIDQIVGLHEVEVEITSVQSEMDGNSVAVRDEHGVIYTAVISIPNLGPNSDFDFDHLRVGNRMIVSGEVWASEGGKRLTIREATAV